MRFGTFWKAAENDRHVCQLQRIRTSFKLAQVVDQEMEVIVRRIAVQRQYRLSHM